MKPVVHNKQQNTRKNGFTLLELMVVLAIIGILATFGASQFQKYIARARVTEGLALAQPYKLAIEEKITTSGGVFTQEQLGLPKFTATQNVTDITVSRMETPGNGGVITITFGANIGGKAGSTLTLTPIMNSAAIRWLCAADGVTQAGAGKRSDTTATDASDAATNPGFKAGSLDPAFAPANCRG